MKGKSPFGRSRMPDFRLNRRLMEIGLPPGTVATMFDFIDPRDGRPARNPRNPRVFSAVLEKDMAWRPGFH